MKLIEAEKVKRVMKDYWKAQVDKALTLTFIDGNEANKRINSYLEHNHELLKAIDELPSAEPDTTTHDSIPAKTGKNDGDGTSGDCISRQAAIEHWRRIIDATSTDSGYNMGFVDGLEFCISHLSTMPSAQPFHNITMTDVMKYIDGMPEDVWQEFTACLECRGWELQRRTAKWCGGDFA